MTAQKQPEPILPKDAAQAVQKMTQITSELADFIEAESNAVAMNDEVSFSMAEGAKAPAAERYQDAAAEFSARVPEIRGKVAPQFIDRLEEAKNRLQQVTKDNLAMLSAIPGLVESVENADVGKTAEG